jgi:hypothetical protein
MLLFTSKFARAIATGMKKHLLTSFLLKNIICSEALFLLRMMLRMNGVEVLRYFFAWKKQFIIIKSCNLIETVILRLLSCLSITKDHLTDELFICTCCASIC